MPPRPHAAALPRSADRSMNRLPVALVALLIGVALLSSPPSTGVASGAQVAITNVTASPTQPAVGDVVTFHATIRNAAGSSGDFTVTDVSLRDANPPQNYYDHVEDLGTVAPGESIDLPMTATFSSPGVKNLRVVVLGRDENKVPVSREYPVTVTVTDRGPQLVVDAGKPVAGEKAPVNVTVSNGGTDPIRQLDLHLQGPGVDVEAPHRLVGQLDGGQDRTFVFNTTFAAAGQQPVQATLQYATASGQARTIRASDAVAVDALREDVNVEAAVGSGGGSRPPVSVDVTNFGNARLEDVDLRVAHAGRTLARRSLANVPAGGSRTVDVNLSSPVTGVLNVTLDYRTGGTDGQATSSVRYAAQPGRIELTGIDYSLGDGGVTTISGSASNVGLSEANSVVVRVQPADGVRPVSPNREYFVGTVPASDFVSFDLTARVDDNVTAIPIQVSYLADGESHTVSTSVPYDAGVTASAPSNRGSSGTGLLLPIAVLVVVLLAVGGGIYWLRRRGRRGGE